jgi:hypothetical protein
MGHLVIDSFFIKSVIKLANYSRLESVLRDLTVSFKDLPSLPKFSIRIQALLIEKLSEPFQVLNNLEGLIWTFAFYKQILKYFFRKIKIVMDLIDFGLLLLDLFKIRNFLSKKPEILKYKYLLKIIFDSFKQAIDSVS